MNTDELKAGPELDALIAKHVFGWDELSVLWENIAGQRFHENEPSLGFPPDSNWERKTIGGYCYWTLNKAKPVPKFSTDLMAAWEVLMEIHRRTRFVRVTKDTRLGPDMWWLVEWKEDGVAFGGDGELPSVICRAALIAVGK